MSTHLTIHGTIGAQKLANSLSNTSNEILNLGERSLVKGITVEGAGYLIGGASAVYNAYKFIEKPSIGRFLETVIGTVSLCPGWGWTIGATYFFADLVTQGITGKSIADNIDN